MLELNWIEVKEWIDPTKLYVPDYVDYYGTYKAFIGVLDIKEIKDFKGYNGENPQYEDNYFGKYTLSRWNKFLTDIKENGIKQPIEILIKDDKGFVSNGNHRLQACLQLNIKNIPVLVRYC